MLSPKTGRIQELVGVESALAFGDALFNIPLIRSLHDYHNAKVVVATKQQYTDGYINIPWIKKTITINNINDGMHILKSMGVQHRYQITQNIKFFEFRSIDCNHSLIDTPLWTGRQIGLPDFDQRPIFIPTAAEIQRTEGIKSNIPTIAIESEARSGQSWA